MGNGDDFMLLYIYLFIMELIKLEGLIMRISIKFLLEGENLF